MAASTAWAWTAAMPARVAEESNAPALASDSITFLSQATVSIFFMKSAQS